MRVGINSNLGNVHSMKTEDNLKLKQISMDIVMLICLMDLNISLTKYID